MSLKYRTKSSLLSISSSSGSVIQFISLISDHSTRKGLLRQNSSQIQLVFTLPAFTGVWEQLWSKWGNWNVYFIQFKQITSDNLAYFVMKRDMASSLIFLSSESIADKDFTAASSSSGDPYPWVLTLSKVQRGCSLTTSVKLRNGST